MLLVAQSFCSSCRLAGLALLSPPTPRCVGGGGERCLNELILSRMACTRASRSLLTHLCPRTSSSRRLGDCALCALNAISCICLHLSAKMKGCMSSKHPSTSVRAKGSTQHAVVKAYVTTLRSARAEAYQVGGSLDKACLSCRLCACLLYTSPSPRDKRQSRMPSSA